MTVWAGVALEAAVVREAHRGVYANVPTPNHHYSFCEGGNYTTGLGVLSGSQTDVVIADHITGDSAHALKWSGRFEQFREVPAESAVNAEVCCAANLRKFGFTITARASNGIFRDTVDSLDAESVDEGRRCHAAA